MQNGNSTSLCTETLSLETIMAAAENNDPLATNLLKEFGELLGILCINLVNTLNMELLVISGKLIRKSNVLLKFIVDKVHNDLLRAPAHAVKIIGAELNEQGGVMGSAGLVLEDLFYKDRINVIKYRDVFKQN